MLLAVSGGKDSVCMTQLFHEAGLNFALAHCNFQLRGEASDADEQFVKALAKSLNVDFFSTSFDTTGYSSDRGISTQMAARDLRYNFFEELINEHGFAGVATAHHMDDVVETMLLNLSRGTGIAGLHGILPVRGHLYRPLLFTNSDEILVYLSNKGMIWREDQTNSEIKYKRNLLRHKVLPVLREINPSFQKAFSETANKLRLSESYLKDSLIGLKQTFIDNGVDESIIDIETLKAEQHCLLILDAIISEFGFNMSDAQLIISGDFQSGKKLFSHTHELLFDRDRLIIRNIGLTEKNAAIQIDEVGVYEWMGGTIKVEQVVMSMKDVTPLNNIAYANAMSFDFPITVRLWESGDSFQPFGMKGKKKLSDFLIDEKVSLNDKEKVAVVVANNRILWVVNHRIDDSVKLTDSTTEVIKLTWTR